MKEDVKEEPVFPHTLRSYGLTFKGDGGLTKRELFSAMIMQGFAANGQLSYGAVSAIADDAVAWADALLETLIREGK